MHRVRSRALTLLAFVALSQASGSAGAQAARTGGAPSAQLMQQMQQLASERTALQAENGRMKRELEDLRKERDQLKSAQKKALEQRAQMGTAALVRVTSDRDRVEQELTQHKAKTQELVAKFRETLETLRTVETESTTAKQSLVTRDQELKTCVDRNTALLDLNKEILARVEKPGALSRVARAEPFTQIGRVRRENMVDDYKSRAEDLRVPAPAPDTKAPVPSPKPATSGSEER